MSLFLSLPKALFRLYEKTTHKEQNTLKHGNVYSTCMVVDGSNSNTRNPQRRFNCPPFLLRTRQKQRDASPPMDSDLRSSRPLAAIGIVDESQGLQLGHFHSDSQFASFRSVDNVDPHQPLQSATAQDAIALESNAQATTEDGISLLQSDPAFQQPNYGGLAPDTTASTSFAGQLQGKLIPDPPDLEYWRDRLFHVDETITLSEEQYATSCCNQSLERH
jgi:hypothetical protein